MNILERPELKPSYDVRKLFGNLFGKGKIRKGKILSEAMVFYPGDSGFPTPDQEKIILEIANKIQKGRIYD